jgi:two-component system NarL family sensor kinase
MVIADMKGGKVRSSGLSGEDSPPQPHGGPEARIRLDERQRIARELHDSTAQLLVTLELHIMRLKRLLRTSDSAVVEEVLAALGTTLDDLHAQVRAVAQPHDIDPRELPGQLAALATDLANCAGLILDVDIDRLPPSASPAIASSLYRVGQEALANVVRHADASSADLTLKTGGHSAMLRIVDDGVGIERAAASHSEGRGIANMKARIEEVGGTLLIRDLGPGTMVEASVDWTPNLVTSQ